MRRKGRKSGEPAGERTDMERRGVRAVIVDDSALMRESLQVFFRRQDGSEVVGVAETGLEGVERVAQLGPDLVVMDVRMPGMDGLEATRRIKARGDGPVVIMFTLEEGEGVLARAKSVAADDFVVKGPEAWDALAAAIRRAFPGVKVEGRR